MASVLFFNGESLDDFSTVYGTLKREERERYTTTYQRSFRLDRAKDYGRLPEDGQTSQDLKVPIVNTTRKKSITKKPAEQALPMLTDRRKSRQSTKRAVRPSVAAAAVGDVVPSRSRSQVVVANRKLMPSNSIGEDNKMLPVNNGRRSKMFASSTGHLDRLENDEDIIDDRFDQLGDRSDRRLYQFNSRFDKETYNDEIEDEENFDGQPYSEDQEASFLSDNLQPSNPAAIDQTTFTAYTNSNFVPSYSLEEIYEIWRMALPIEEIYVNEKLSRLKSLLRLNGVTRNIYKSYKVRVINNAIIFPRFLSAQESRFDGLDFLPSGLKIIRLPEFNSNVRVEFHPNKNVYCGMFGYNLVTAMHSEVVLVSNESDALAVYQATKEQIPSLVLPDVSTTLCDDALPHLLQFARVTIWLPHEHQVTARQFARKLTPSRCHIITHRVSQRLPSEMLETGNIDLAAEKIAHIIGIAEPLFPKDVETFQMLRESVKNFVLTSEYTGKVAVWQRFPILAQIFKGFRLGEMTVLTGSTGCGKSTFLSEYSLDLCEQNVSTLWCNLESPNSRLVSIMVQQYARKGFGPGDSEFDFWYNKLMSLPMYFTHIDSSTSNSIIDTINGLILSHGIQHVIVDNLQWMASLNSTDHPPQNDLSARNGGDQRVDALCTYFQRLTREKPVHVTLVVHPEIENEESGISFTALHGNELKAFQQADNVLVMQRKISRLKDNVREKCLQVWKNRFAGEVIYSDRLLMLFDSKTKCHRIVNRKFSQQD